MRAAVVVTAFQVVLPSNVIATELISQEPLQPLAYYEAILDGNPMAGELAGVTSDRARISFRRDKNGRLVESVDDRGGRVIFEYGENGSVMSKSFFDGDRRLGRQEYLYDEKGNIVFSSAGTETGAAEELSRVFDIADPLAGMEMTDRSSNLVEDFSVSNPFGEVTIRRPLDPAATATETTRVGAVELTTTVRRLGDRGLAVSDDRGGWRLERYFHTGTLLSVEDKQGMVADVIRDGSGRPVAVLVGNNLALEYSYSKSSTAWDRKVLSDLNTGEILADLSNSRVVDGRLASGPGPIRPPSHRVAQAWLPCFGPLAERHEAYGNRWHAVAHVNGRRYAMLPLTAEGPVIRSVFIEGTAAVPLLDRIDYTDARVVLHLATGDLDRTLVVAAPRHAAGADRPMVVHGDGSDNAQPDVVVSMGALPPVDVVFKPRLNGALPFDVTRKLLGGFPLALERVRELASCRGLFEPLVVSGVERLSTTLYTPENAKRTNDSCDKGAMAYTYVGSPVTHLCAGFGKLSREQAAIVLIHEALHFAGLPEAPSTPDALTSRQINRLVQKACGL